MREFAIIVIAILVALFVWTHTSHGATPKVVGTIPAMQFVKASPEYTATRLGVKATCQSFLTVNGYLVEVCAPNAKAPAVKRHSSTSHFSA